MSSGAVNPGAATPAAASRKSGRPAPASRTAKVLEAFHEEGSLGKVYDWQLLRRLWPYVRPYRGMIYTSLFMGVLTSATSLLQPLFMRDLLDDGVLAGDMTALGKG